jgi:membrane protein YqaA with SNARE-associated domain
MILTLAASPIWSLIRRVGAFAFIPIGIIDNSLIPTFGGMDAVLVVMAASNREYWWYYALAALIGAIIGAYVTYRISAKGGKEMLEKKLGEKTAKKAYGVFDRWGFWSIFLAAIAPPPFPAAPVLATAGAMQYSRRNFLIAVSGGRAIRYGISAWVASRYGRHVFSFFSRYYKPALWTLVAMGVLGGVAFIFWFKKYRRAHPKESERKQTAERNVA